jgi:uncharacterized protein (TIGR02001 family)
MSDNNRKPFVLIVLLFLFVSGASGLNAGSLSGQLDFMSRYIWRGWDLNPDKKPVMQPSFTYTFGDSGFAANVWLSISSEDKEVNETDITLSYDFKLSETVSLSAGLIHYGWYFARGFKFKNDTSYELFVSAAFPKLPLSPGVAVYYDFHLGDGMYARFSVAQSIKLAETITADLSASLGYNDGQYLEDFMDDGFSDFNIGIALPFKLGRTSVTPLINYTIVLLDDISKNNHLWFGVSLAF